jgi:hypothetical protein
MTTTPSEVTAEQMDEFCRVLREGGVLMVHPEAWATLKRLAPSAAMALEWSAILGGTKVRPNPHVDPDTLYAVPKESPNA